MSKLTIESADALLPQISKIETTISELNYHVGRPVKFDYHGSCVRDQSRPESFDPIALDQGQVSAVLNQLWGEMNDLCNAIAKALDSDGPSCDAESSRRDSAAPSQPELEDL